LPISYYMFATRDDIASLKAALLKLLGNDDLEGAKKRLKASKSFEARIVLSGLDGARDGAASAEERMQGEAGMSKLAMERNLAFVGTVGNNAPFIGLLGTVIGVIRAFHELDVSQGQVSAGLMAQIGEALVATAIGLLVALPAVAFFNLFMRMIKARIARGDALGHDVLAHLKSQRLKPAGPFRTPDDGDEEPKDTKTAKASKPSKDEG
ncbi:MAG: MotA/TolQ/ExbB proton channel family protein, partial [Sandaracinaceae bacterium]